MTAPENDLDLNAGPAAADTDEAPDTTPRSVLEPGEALDRLRRGLTVENVRIERLTFKGEFTGPVRLKRCVLVQPRFDGAVFHDEVHMPHCTLDRPQFGKPTEFQRCWNLSGANFHRVQLLRFTVKGDCNCEYARTRGKFTVVDGRFEGKVRFWEARFEGWTEFARCEFHGESDFRSFHADEGFVLKDCQFLGDALFRGSSVAKKFDATNSRFEKALDFSKAKLHDYTYLETIQQGEQQRFAFANTLGERVRVRPEQLDGRLASEQAGDYGTAMHEYAFLKRNFESLHNYDREDWAFYRFKVNQRRCCERSWYRPWTKIGEFFDWLLLDQGCGYCTNPYRAIRTALLIILCFGLIYAAGLSHFNVEELKKLPFGPDVYSPLNRLTIGMFKSVAVFTSGLSSIHDISESWMNLALMTESLLGTLLWGLFIVAFSRKVIR